MANVKAVPLSEGDATAGDFEQPTAEQVNESEPERFESTVPNLGRLMLSPGDWRTAEALEAERYDVDYLLTRGLLHSSSPDRETPAMVYEVIPDELPGGSHKHGDLRTAAEFAEAGHDYEDLLRAGLVKPVPHHIGSGLRSSTQPVENQDVPPETLQRYEPSPADYGARLLAEQFARDPQILTTLLTRTHELSEPKTAKR